MFWKCSIRSRCNFSRISRLTFRNLNLKELSQSPPCLAINKKKPRIAKDKRRAHEGSWTLPLPRHFGPVFGQCPSRSVPFLTPFLPRQESSSSRLIVQATSAYDPRTRGMLLKEYTLEAFLCTSFERERLESSKGGTGCGNGRAVRSIVWKSASYFNASRAPSPPLSSFQVLVW